MVYSSQARPVGSGVRSTTPVRSAAVSSATPVVSSYTGGTTYSSGTSYASGVTAARTIEPTYATGTSITQAQPTGTFSASSAIRPANTTTVTSDRPADLVDAPKIAGATPISKSTTTTTTYTYASDAPGQVTRAAPVSSVTPSVLSSTAAVVSATPAVVSATPAVVSAAPAIVSAAPTVVSAAPAIVSAAPAVVSAAPAMITPTPAVASSTTYMPGAVGSSSTYMPGQYNADYGTPSAVGSSSTYMPGQYSAGMPAMGATGMPPMGATGMPAMGATGMAPMQTMGGYGMPQMPQGPQDMYGMSQGMPQAMPQGMQQGMGMQGMMPGASPFVFGSAGPQMDGASSAAPEPAPVYTMGQSVDVWSSSENGWIAAEVIKVEPDGGVTVKYGKNQKDISPIHLKEWLRPSAKIVDPLPPGKTNVPPQGYAYVVGQAVEVFSKSDSAWVAATVQNVAPDGVVTVRWGRNQKDLAPNFLWEYLRPAAPDSSATNGFAPPDTCAQGMFAPTTMGPPATMGPSGPGSAPSVTVCPYAVGDNVLVFSKSESNWVPAQVVTIEQDGTIIVRYGNNQKNIPPSEYDRYLQKAAPSGGVPVDTMYMPPENYENPKSASYVAPPQIDMMYAGAGMGQPMSDAGAGMGQPMYEAPPTAFGNNQAMMAPPTAYGSPGFATGMEAPPTAYAQAAGYAQPPTLPGGYS